MHKKRGIVLFLLLYGTFFSDAEAENHKIEDEIKELSKDYKQCILPSWKIWSREIYKNEAIRRISKMCEERIILRVLIGHGKTPEIANLYMSAAQIYYILGEYDNALRRIKDAIVLKPTAGAYMVRGRIYRRLGKLAEAKADFQTVLRLHPGASIAEEALKELGVNRSSLLSQRILVIRANASGHFYIDAMINKTTIRLLVDTGATVSTLSMDDARKARLPVGSLKFNYPVQTANGIVYAAVADIKEFRVKEVIFRNEPILIIPDTEGSIMGIMTLRKFRTYSVTGDIMKIEY